MHTLSELDRVHLLLALQATIKEETLLDLDTDYVNDLVKLMKTSPPHSSLTRQVSLYWLFFTLVYQ